MYNNPILELQNNLRSSGNQQLNQQQSQWNLGPIKNLMSQVKMASNPQMIVNQLINSNQNLRNILDIARLNNTSLKDIYYTLAAQRGVDPDALLRELNK